MNGTILYILKIWYSLNRNSQFVLSHLVHIVNFMFSGYSSFDGSFTPQSF